MFLAPRTNAPGPFDGQKQATFLDTASVIGADAITLPVANDVRRTLVLMSGSLALHRDFLR
jgi:hypothetical protein